MKFAGKEFSFYWPIIKIPLFVLVAWSVLGLIVAVISINLFYSIFSSYASWTLSILVFGFIGWSAVKDHNLIIKESSWAGALCGILVGFLGGIIGILMVFFVPSIVELALSQAAAQGSPMGMGQLRQFMIIGSFVGLIIGPLINGLIGAGISALGGLIGKKVK